MMRVVLSSCPASAAEGIAHALVSSRHAACVSVLPQAVSTYRWQGEVVVEQEHLLLIKVPIHAAAELMAELARIHPYDVPEIIALPVAHVAASYSRWATKQLG